MATSGGNLQIHKIRGTRDGIGIVRARASVTPHANRFVATGVAQFATPPVASCGAALSNGTRSYQHAGGEVARLSSEWSALQHRRRWELWLPLPVVLVAVLTFVIRSFW